MRRKALALLAALSVFLALPLGAQRILAGNGSAAAPSITFNSDANLGLYRFGADTLGVATNGAHSLSISGGAAVTLRGGAGNMTIQCGTGNSRTCTFQSTTSAGTAKNTLVLGADSSATFLGPARGMAGGSASLPAYSFIGSTQSGHYFSGGTVGTSIVGTERFRVGADYAVASGTAGLLIGANGTAAAPSLAFNNGGDTGWRLGNNGSSDTLVTVVNGTNTRFNNATRDSLAIRAVFTGDTIRATSKVRLTALTAAAGTPNTVCIDATTKEITENAATSCVVSSRRFKTNILPLSDVVAARITAQLKPSVFKYKDGGRNAIGLIAEEANSVDSRLATRDDKGRINSVNYEQVTVVLLKHVQALTAKLDHMCKAGIREAC